MKHPQNFFKSARGRSAYPPSSTSRCAPIKSPSPLRSRVCTVDKPAAPRTFWTQSQNSANPQFPQSRQPRGLNHSRGHWTFCPSLCCKAKANSNNHPLNYHPLSIPPTSNLSQLSHEMLKLARSKRTAKPKVPGTRYPKPSPETLYSGLSGLSKGANISFVLAASCLLCCAMLLILVDHRKHTRTPTPAKSSQEDNKNSTTL